MSDVRKRELLSDGRVVWTGAAEARKRAGRELRDRYLEHLTQMFEQEYLNETEFTERAEKIVAARFEDDLPPLIRDLPSLPARATTFAPDKSLISKPARAHVDLSHLRPGRHPAAWSFAGACAGVASFLPADIAASAAYGGLGNSPVGYAFLTIFGGIVAFVSVIFTLGSLFG